MHELTTLENGVRVVTTTMPATLSVSVGLFLGVGSRYEGEAESGISHFAEHMGFKGTHRRPTLKDIAQAIEGVGGLMNAGTGPEHTFYWIKVPGPHLDLALDVLSDMLRQPILDSQEMEKERQVIIEELHMIHDMPDEWVGVLFKRAMWPEHPLGRDTGGNEQTVGSITRDDLVSFLARTYVTPRLVVSVAGNVDHAEVCERGRDYLGDWGTGDAAECIPAEPLPPGPHVSVEARDTQQAHLLLGVRGIPRRAHDRYAATLLSAILGQGMSSRLSLEIRERLGLAYAVYCFSQHLTDTGAIVVSAGVGPQNGPKAIRAILGELRRTQDDPVPADELNRSKEYLKGRLMLRMEDTFSNASWLGQQEVLDGVILSVKEVMAEIDAVTSEDIQRMAQQLFRTEELVLTMVAPAVEPDEVRLLLEV